jgi:small-conductance mechanosensitive channel
MLLIVLALFWVALLAPIAIRRLRDGGTEKSIQSFHAEHEILSRQDYSVAPAHRLDQPDQAAPNEHPSERRPRLTVVHADDTFGSLESRSSWDEWSEDYDYNDPVRPATPIANRYVKAYSSRPDEVVVTQRYETPMRRRTMKSQRRMMFSRLVLVAIVLTLAALVTGSSLVFDVAALSLLAVVAFVALAFYSVSQGYLSDSSLPIRVPQRRQLATIEPLYSQGYDRSSAYYEDEYQSEYYEPESSPQWDRQPRRRRALG